jgi:hypothetical protein
VETDELRYADRPTTRVEQAIDAAPAVVWALVCDIDLPARFSSEFRGAQWLGGVTRPALGAQFTGRNHHDAVGEWETVSTICEFEPERVLGWAVGDTENPSAVWLFTLTPAEGGTVLAQSAQLGPGPSGVSALIERMPDKEHRILRRRLAEHQANMAATVAGIKTLAEAG